MQVEALEPRWLAGYVHIDLRGQVHLDFGGFPKEGCLGETAGPMALGWSRGLQLPLEYEPWALLLIYYPFIVSTLVDWISRCGAEN